MSSELAAWLTDEAKTYFEHQSDYLTEANSLLGSKKQKQVEAVNKINTPLPNRKKKRTSRQRYDFQYEISMDRNLQFSYAQLNRLGWRTEKQKQKEASKTSLQNKKKTQIDWTEGEKAILESYKKFYSYVSCKVARMDKRELLRIAQEVQALNRIRRTCLPILKLPHNLIVQPPGVEIYGNHTSFTKKTEIKKYGPTRGLVQISTINNDVQRGQPPKKRRLTKQTLPHDKNKSECREYMEINKVYLNFDEEFPNNFYRYRKCIKPHTLPDLKAYLNEQYAANASREAQGNYGHGNVEASQEKNTLLLPDLFLNSYTYKGKKLFLHNNDINIRVETPNSRNRLNLFNKHTIIGRNSMTHKGITNKPVKNKNSNLNMGNTFKFKSGNTISNIYEFNESYSNIKASSEEKKIGEKISKILLENDEYNLTINKGGQLEQVKVFVGPALNEDNSNLSDQLDSKTKKRKNDYINILQPVVVSTKSGTSFEMKPTKPISPHLKSFENDNMYKHKKKIVPLITPKL